MTFKNFSAGLISTLDLDPDYIVIKEIARETGLTKPEILNWIIHKVFIYDTASEYNVIFRGADINKVRLGAERRKNKQNTVKQLEQVLDEFRLPVEVLHGSKAMSYNAFKNYVTKFPGIGDWAAWKFADLLERVLGVNIDFSKVDFRTAYTFPLRGLCRVNEEEDAFVAKLNDDFVYNVFMHCATKQLEEVLDWTAPGGGRKINIQEIETCLCKYHSFLSGHYKIGNDSKHLMERFEHEKITMPELFTANFERSGFKTKLL